MSVKTLTIDDKPVSASEDATILDAAREAGITIPTLCHLDGVYDVGACRLCLVEVEGIPKLLPACTTTVREGWVVHTNSERLQNYRRMTIARDGKTRVMKRSRQDKGHQAEIESFLAAVAGGGPSPIGFDDLCATTEVTFRIVEQIAAG